MTRLHEGGVLRAFWWSPRRDAHLGTKELRRNASAWIRMQSKSSVFLSNFGDELTPYVLEYATGRKVRWTPAKSAEVIAVGSIIEYYARRSTSNAIVWGAGLRDVPSPETLDRIKNSVGGFAAVRGPRTARILGQSAAGAALGDPGVLAPELVKYSNPRRGVLYLPHFRTWTTPTGRKELKVARELGMRIAPPSLAPLDMIEAISKSDLVLSSSLHGVIVAHALGVPVQSLRIKSRGMAEPDHKYLDYYESVGVQMDRVGIEDCFDSRDLKALLARRESEVDSARVATRRLAENLVVSSAVFR